MLRQLAELVTLIPLSQIRFADGRIAVKITSDGPGKDKELHVDKSKLRHIFPPSPPPRPTVMTDAERAHEQRTQSWGYTTGTDQQGASFPDSQHGWDRPVNPASTPVLGSSGGRPDPRVIDPSAQPRETRSISRAPPHSNNFTNALHSRLPNTHHDAYRPPASPGSPRQRQHTPTLSPVIGSVSQRVRDGVGHRGWAGTEPPVRVLSMSTNVGSAVSVANSEYAPAAVPLGYGVVTQLGQQVIPHSTATPFAFDAYGFPLEPEPSQPVSSTHQMPIGSGRRFAAPPASNDGGPYASTAPVFSTHPGFELGQPLGPTPVSSGDWVGFGDATLPSQSWAPSPNNFISEPYKTPAATSVDPWAHTPASAQPTTPFPG